MASRTSLAQLKINNSDKSITSRSLFKTALIRLKRDRLTMIAIAILMVLSLLALFAPLISQYILHTTPTDTSAEPYLSVGTPGHILGTDDLGRDHLTRLLYAGRVSLGIAFVSASVALIIGVALGIITGYYGGWVDDFIIWLVTTIDSIPFFFIVLIIAAVLSPGAETLIIVLGFLGWTGTTRLVRGETLSIKNRDYITSARALGASSFRIMMFHIFPNLVSTVVINLAITIGVLILVEASLSFLGVGVKPPTPTWGNMLTQAQTFYTYGPHLVFWPGFLIFLTVLCLYIIGDGIRDAFDPTTRY